MNLEALNSWIKYACYIEYKNAMLHWMHFNALILNNIAFSWEVDMIAKSATMYSIGLGHGMVLLIFPWLGNDSDGLWKFRRRVWLWGRLYMILKTFKNASLCRLATGDLYATFTYEWLAVRCESDYAFGEWYWDSTCMAYGLIIIAFVLVAIHDITFHFS